MRKSIPKNAPIYIAGHRGMVGSAFVRHLTGQGFTNLLTASHAQLDLRDANQTKHFFQRQRPAYVILAAAKVGGINANRTFPADFLYDNLMIQNNVFYWAQQTGVKKLLFLGSSCIYPRVCPQPIKEEYLLTGPLEPTNEGYALAKIAGLKLAQHFHQQHGFQSVCVMPCNLYGPNDSFHPEHSHVLSALVKKFSDAVANGQSKVVLWGSGRARREFLHVDDLVRLALAVMERRHTPDIINLGSGHDLTIRQLARLIARQTGFGGTIRWDRTMPDGMPRKCLDISKMTALGLQPAIPLSTGLAGVIAEYQKRYA